MGVSGQTVVLMFIEMAGSWSNLLALASILLPVAIIGAGAAAGLAAGTIGGLANLFAPQGENLKSFVGQTSGGVDLTPSAILGEFLRGMNIYGGFMTQRAEQPFQWSNSARVQTPHYFAGGGLPMALGVSGVDQGYYPYTGFTPTYPRATGNKTFDGNPFGSYGGPPPPPRDTGGDPPDRDPIIPGEPPKASMRDSGDPAGTDAASYLARTPATADPGPNPTAADFQNMLGAIRQMRGVQ